MTSRRLGRTALLVLAAAFLAALTPPLTARPASACIVSYDYRPNIKVDYKNPGSGLGKPCRDDTSYAGVTFVVALAIAALGIAGVRTVRRGTALTATPAPDQAGARRAILTGYLRAAVVWPPSPNPAAPPYPGPGGPGPAGQHPAPGAVPYSGLGAPYRGPDMLPPAVPPPPPMPGYVNPPPPGPGGRHQGGPAAPPSNSERTEDR
ncbi:hypothetical protein AB0L00_23415 [Actinoallomurus sp. NPDC052308]|uniref:hypothetical protein n=1 Tax=Actinoallomurus sp. NPDC052308 TaxID=3155530 RepID=UPI00343FAC43